MPATLIASAHANLPKAAQREGTPETAKDLIVGVDRSGQFFMDGQKKTLPEIEGKLKAAAQANPEVRVLVKGDRDVAYGRITDIMNVVREARIVHVVLPTDPKLDAPATATTR